MVVKMSERPNCVEMLAAKHEWAYDFDFINTYIQNKGVIIDLNESYRIEDHFVNYFLQSKYRINP
jgi:hypothetical protein